MLYKWAINIYNSGYKVKYDLMKCYRDHYLIKIKTKDQEIKNGDN